MGSYFMLKIKTQSAILLEVAITLLKLHLKVQASLLVIKTPEFITRVCFEFGL